MICIFGKPPEECKGRIFGAWANCVHGWKGEREELLKIVDQLQLKIEAFESGTYDSSGGR